MLATMKIHLSPEQKHALELMHDTTRDSRVCDRIKAVLLASEATVLNTIFMAALKALSLPNKPPT